MALSLQHDDSWYDSDVRFLQQNKLFSTVDLMTLEEVARTVVREVHPKGLLIDVIDDVFVIKRGRVRVYRLSRDGDTITLKILHIGDAFFRSVADLIVPRFNLPLTMPGSTSGSRVCYETLTDAVIYRIPHNTLQRLIAAHPQVAAVLFQLLMGWFVDAYTQLDELVFLNLPRRLARTLARLASANDQHIVPETHEELGWLVGASRERVTKELNNLRRLRLIDYQRHRTGIRVLDADRLGSM